MDDMDVARPFETQLSQEGLGLHETANGEEEEEGKMSGGGDDDLRVYITMAVIVTVATVVTLAKVVIQEVIQQEVHLNGTSIV
jgi:hypothetical protein